MPAKEVISTASPTLRDSGDASDAKEFVVVGTDKPELVAVQCGGPRPTPCSGPCRPPAPGQCAQRCRVVTPQEGKYGKITRG